jgi:hypothetical protein
MLVSWTAAGKAATFVDSFKGTKDGRAPYLVLRNTLMENMNKKTRNPRLKQP